MSIRHLGLPLLIASLGTVGCDVAQPPAPIDAAPVSQQSPPSVDNAPPAEPAGSELLEARTACSEDDFIGFLEVFVRSSTVARLYTAAQVNVVRGTSAADVRGADYPGPPITLMDKTWVTTPSAEIGPPFDRIEVRTKRDTDDHIQVNWRLIEYPPQSTPETEGGVPQQVDPGGTLIFASSPKCWALTEDRIDPAS